MFKEGDIVYVKENAYDIPVSGISFNQLMKQYCGKSFMIKSGYHDRWQLENVTCNQGENYCGYWLWADDWLEPAHMTNIQEITNEDLEKLFN